MSREQNFTAIILKKQPFGEADEIITFFTQELGKVRGLAKSIKLQKSKLQQKLQALFLVKVALTRGRLPKIIRAETINTFSHLRHNLQALPHAFYGLELAMKATADEQRNEMLYERLLELLNFLNAADNDKFFFLMSLRFKLQALKALGLMPILPQSGGGAQTKYFFSPHRGGFTKESTAVSWPVEEKAITLLQDLDSAANLNKIQSDQKSLIAAQELLSAFVEYYLERKLKSDNVKFGQG